MTPMSSYRTLVPMRWSDMDVYRHINNVQVVRLLEEARVQAFTAWDDPGERPVLESGVLVARTEVEYLRQLDFRIEPIAIDLWVSKMSGRDHRARLRGARAGRRLAAVRAGGVDPGDVRSAGRTAASTESR